jgi:hypothetical protein
LCHGEDVPPELEGDVHQRRLAEVDHLRLLHFLVLVHPPPLLVFVFVQQIPRYERPGQGAERPAQARESHGLLGRVARDVGGLVLPRRDVRRTTAGLGRRIGVVVVEHELAVLLEGGVLAESRTGITPRTTTTTTRGTTRIPPLLPARRRRRR